MKAKTRDYPLTSDELREIADSLDEIHKTLNHDDDYLEGWRAAVTVDITDDIGYVVGQVRVHDGWLGFFPNAIEE